MAGESEPIVALYAFGYIGSTAAQWAGTNEQNVAHMKGCAAAPRIKPYIYTYIGKEGVYIGIIHERERESLYSPVPSEIWIYARLDAWGPVCSDSQCAQAIIYVRVDARAGRFFGSSCILCCCCRCVYVCVCVCVSRRLRRLLCQN